MTDSDGPVRCGVGIRGVAMAIDTVVWIALLFVAVFAVAAATGQVEQTADGVTTDLTGPAAGVALVCWFGLAIGYHTLLEWRYGRTIGKHIVAIRVQSLDGSRPSLGASLVRNLLRLVEWLPSLYGAAIVVLALSDRNQRLGDRLAGTVVVRP